MEKKLPGTRNVIDLSFDRHEQRLVRIRAVVKLQLFLGDVAELDRFTVGNFVGSLDGGVIIGGNKHAADKLVGDEHEGEDGEEGGWGEAGVGIDGVGESLPERHGS